MSLATRDIVGFVSTGVFSPVLDTSTAVALLDVDAQQATLGVDVRGKREAGTIVSKLYCKGM